MNPDPRERLPREIFEELMEEGAEAFRNVLEKLLNLAWSDPSFWERNHTRGRAGGEITPTASRTRPWPRGWDA